MKSLYVNIVLGAVAALAVAFGVYEYTRSQTILAELPATAAATPAAPGGARPAAPSFYNKATDGDWQIRCRTGVTDPSKGGCAAVMNVVNAKKQVVLIWVVGANRQGGLTMTLQTPTGMALAQGLRLTFDKNPPHTLAYSACGPRACRAAALLDAALTDEMRKAAEAHVVLALQNGRALNVGMQLKGTDQMLTDLSTTPAAPAKP